MNKPITIYLADDHQIIIDGLMLLIGSEASMKVVGYAKDAATACKEIAVKRPDLAIIDLRMPGEQDGMDVLHLLRKTVPDTRFIILSMHDKQEHIRDARSAGAAGYLLKNSGRAELMKCLSAVLEGKEYFPDLKSTKAINSKPLFTPRETQILKLVLEEHTTAQIANKLSLSTYTVETHRKNICRKANANTPLGLVNFLRDNEIKI